MFNKLLIFSTLTLLVISFTACSPYPENPLVSLASKKARVANSWKVVYATNDDGDDVTDSRDEDRYIFSKEGAAEARTQLAGATLVLLGEWEFEEDNEAFKITLEYTLLGATIRDTDQFDILKLTKDEFWLQSQEDPDVVLHLESF